MIDNEMGLKLNLGRRSGERIYSHEAEILGVFDVYMNISVGSSKSNVSSSFDPIMLQYILLRRNERQFSFISRRPYIQLKEIDPKHQLQTYVASYSDQ